jgi:hypothetical protein
MPISETLGKWALFAFCGGSRIRSRTIADDRAQHRTIAKSENRSAIGIAPRPDHRSSAGLIEIDRDRFNRCPDRSSAVIVSALAPNEGPTHRTPA